MLSALYLEVGRALVPVYRSGGHYALRSQDVAQFGSVGLLFPAAFQAAHRRSILQ